MVTIPTMEMARMGKLVSEEGDGGRGRDFREGWKL